MPTDPRYGTAMSSGVAQALMIILGPVMAHFYARMGSTWTPEIGDAYAFLITTLIGWFVHGQGISLNDIKASILEDLKVPGMKPAPVVQASETAPKGPSLPPVAPSPVSPSSLPPVFSPKS